MQQSGYVGKVDCISIKVVEGNDYFLFDSLHDGQKEQFYVPAGDEPTFGAVFYMVTRAYFAVEKYNIAVEHEAPNEQGLKRVISVSIPNFV